MSILKRLKIPNLSNIEKSVSQGMDSAAAIVKDGEIICACAEERFISKKHTDSFPVNAIRRCLEIPEFLVEELWSEDR